MSALAHEALVLPVGDVVWQRRHRSDAAFLMLADRHYSRKTPGSKWMGAPAAESLALVSPCERAAWLSQWTSYPLDGLVAFRCTFFRNEGAGLSSDLILDAMRLTETLWADVASDDGWVTWVRTAAVMSPNPGYCFQCAGWRVDHEWQPKRGRRGLIRLRADLREVRSSA